MQDTLPQIIQSAEDFRNVFSPLLSAEQRTAVFEAIKDQLPKIIQSAADFSDVLIHLSAEQCTAVCEAIKDQLPQIMQPAVNFRNVFLPLSPEQRTAVFEAMQDILPLIIQSAEDICLTIDTLTPEQKEVVKQQQVICHLQRYILLREKEPSMHWPRCLISIFNHNSPYTSEKKCAVAKKCISILKAESNSFLDATEQKTLKDGRLHGITACVEEKLCPAPTQNIISV